MIEKYYSKGGGKDPRAKSNDETRLNRSIGRHYENKRKTAIDKAKKINGALSINKKDSSPKRDGTYQDRGI